MEDRENKIEMKKLREAMERLSGDRIQDDFIDVWISSPYI